MQLAVLNCELEKGTNMTPNEMGAAMALHKLSQRRLAMVLKCDDKLVRRWKAGGAAIPEPVQEYLVKLAQNPPPENWKSR